jgi:hypothetical protein
MFELGYLVFDSKLLPLDIADDVQVGQRSVDFLIESVFQATMLGPKLFDTVLRRHGTSCWDQMMHERLNANSVWSGGPSTICCRCMTNRQQQLKSV